MYKYFNNIEKNRRIFKFFCENKSFFVSIFEKNSISIIVFSIIFKKFQNIVIFIIDFFREIDFEHVFRDYYYVIKSIKIIKNGEFKKLCFDIEYSIFFIDRV